MAPDAYANRKAKCPKCQVAIKIGPLPSGESSVGSSSAVAASGAKVAGSSSIAKKAAKKPSAVEAKQSKAASESSAARTSRQPATSKQQEKKPEKKPVDRNELGKRLLGGFHGTVEKTTSTFGYKLSIVAVAFLMVLLPLVYIGLIGVVGYGVLWHAANNQSLMDTVPGSGRGREVIFAFLIYITPIIIGPVVVAFMIKPLFSRGEKFQSLRSLKREHEPLLFSFVDKICDTVGSPKPTRIDVDCQVNASASFRQGIWSMFGNDLVLTIGLPLVAGLNTRQFAGVLAHEFGHFSQGAGMRLSYLIRVISIWFNRVVHERDSWDDNLHSAASSIDIRIGWIFWVAILLVWIIRLVLAILDWIGRIMCGYLMREMEFDADRYEARLAGSKAFESTVRQLQLLGAGQSRTNDQLQSSFREGRLADNLPLLILMHARRMPDEVRKAIDEHIEKTETGLFDTHPADRDRIASAKEEGLDGVFQIEEPSSLLFTNFKEQSRATTLGFYRAVFGDELKPGMVHPFGEFAKESARQDAGDKSLMRYTQGLFRAIRPLALHSATINRPDDPKKNVEIIRTAREELMRDAPGARDTLAKIDEAHEQISKAISVQAFRRAGFKLNAKQVGKEFATNEAAKQQRSLAEREVVTRGRQIEQVETIIGKRMLAALELLQLDRIASRIPDGVETRESLEKILPALLGLQGQMASLVKLRDQFVAFSSLLGTLDGGDVSEKFINVVTSLAEKCALAAYDINEALTVFRYPFPHRDKNVTVGDFLLPTRPKKDDVGGVYHAVGEMLDRLGDIQARGVSEIALVAQQVEQVIGLEPLPDPPKPKEEDVDE